MYKANIALRSALKILKPIYHFRAYNESSLYKGIQGIRLVRLPFDANQSFVVDATLYSDHFNHSQFVALKQKMLL